MGGPWRRRIVVAVVAAALQLQSAVDAFTSPHDAQNVNINSYLLDELISQNKQFVSRHPRIADQIISQPSSIFVRSTEEWFTQYLNLSDADQKRIHTRWPNSRSCIERLGRYRLHTWLAFFLSDEIGMDHNQLRKMIISRPQLLSYKLSNIDQTTSYFRDELGLTSNEYKSVLHSYPSVLMYSIDERLRPTVGFLQIECGGGELNWHGWRKIIHTYPGIFAHSIEKRLLPKVQYLCNREGDMPLGLSRSELSQVVSKFPPTLWLSEENLHAKFDFLMTSLSLTTIELRTIVVSYPQILGLSLEKNLAPKMKFFLDANAYEYEGSMPNTDTDSINCGLTKEQLKEFVMYQPALLAYSSNRLKSRISRMKANNIFL